jgi:tryptophan 2,3-dioxygenase
MAHRDEFTRPILPGKGATDYERYLRTDDLLALQKPPAELSHQDEMTFMVVHQSSELLMKGAAFELERAVEFLERGDYGNTARLIRRANQLIDPPIGLLHILETITPYDYHIIRAGLGHGSGLDSPGFLSLLHIAPRLGQAFHDQLKNAGITLDDLYRHHQKHFGLHDVAERMVDFDERMQLFRFHHLKLAERIIGGRVVGTMGTPVEVLEQRMAHWLYKDLWDIRNQITAASNQPESERKG